MVWKINPSLSAHCTEIEIVAVHADEDGIALLEGTLEHLLGEGILDARLDGASEGARAVDRIKAYLGDCLIDTFPDGELEANRLDALAERSQHPRRNLADIVIAQLVEYDDKFKE